MKSCGTSSPMGQGQLGALGPELSHCTRFLLVAMSQVSRAALAIAACELCQEPAHAAPAAAAMAGNAMENRLHQLLGLSVCTLCLGFKKCIY